MIVSLSCVLGKDKNQYRNFKGKIFKNIIIKNCNATVYNILCIKAPLFLIETTATETHYLKYLYLTL